VSRTLRAVARTGLTAGEAIAWWRSAPDGPTGQGPTAEGPAVAGPDGNDTHGRTPVGFGFSARAATWWQVPDGVPMTRHHDAADLTGVFELVGFDGDRELRWRNEHDGRGRAVVLADLPELLPPGEHDVSPDGAIPLGDPQPRILAGRVHLDTPGWVRLTAARYAPVEVPVAPDTAPGIAPDIDSDIDLHARGKEVPVVVLDSVEYAQQDRHGNVSVVDRRLVRLRVVRHEDLRLDLTRIDLTRIDLTRLDLTGPDLTREG
jgi:CRISPR-associated protein (TIGR03984 family)